MLKLKKNAKDFEFQIEGSKTTYRLPAITSLPITDILEIQKLAKHFNDDGEIDEGYETDALELFVNIIRKNEPDVLDQLSYEQFSYLLEAYFNGDTTLGE
jgi:hypothetical protein